MQPWRSGERTGPGAASPQHRSPQYSYFQNWTTHLDEENFYFNFCNLKKAKDRKITFLCFQVEGASTFSKGVSSNQIGGLHVELSFLSWFENNLLSHAQGQYQVTWYLSWSPCCNCAQEVAKFLATNRNVKLTIFIARLYYPERRQNQVGLRQLVSQGVMMKAMSLQDFSQCWEVFVDNHGSMFKPWENLDENYSWQAGNLDQILRGSWNLLKEETFCLHFNNQRRLPKPHPRRRWYLCYQLMSPRGDLLDKGCLQSKKKRHPEIRLICRILSMRLDQAQRYQLCCYLSWSPCLQCAQELEKFASKHKNLGVHIYTARLYCHWLRYFQKGLYLLWKYQVLVTVMGLQEFDDCWKIFVDQEKPFPAWPKLQQCSDKIQNRLDRILKVWSLNDLNDALSDLSLRQ
ncbi:DNA dC-_dU-editing enzyme APOBEC-3-like [Ochotona curzoniae]|uniref:DNA dC->dU-editing enzyme APOBEC-3-like n=1 Tax=Ochotona curzoniae TaxID=130825 RepID=UPI001B34CF1C|nr:DNA dC->dU-editing enzyme APOBEC-3-like [Ochotona curzoniae]